METMWVHPAAEFGSAAEDVRFPARSARAGGRTFRWSSVGEAEYAWLIEGHHHEKLVAALVGTQKTSFAVVHSMAPVQAAG